MFVCPLSGPARARSLLVDPNTSVPDKPNPTIQLHLSSQNSQTKATDNKESNCYFLVYIASRINAGKYRE